MNLVRRRRRLAAILTLANGKWAGKIIAFRWEHITHTYPQNPPPNKGCEGSRSCKLLKGLAPNGTLGREGRPAGDRIDSLCFQQFML